MESDIEIARKANIKRIGEIAEKAGIGRLEWYGDYKGKIPLDHLETSSSRKEGKLVLVTAITPTPAGEGKTTTSIGLCDALNRIGKNASVALREPALGPVFGIKGGAAGGGYAQVVPMEDINLHFTGDFAAIALAHNLLSSVIDNHMHHGNRLDIDVRRIGWRRVMDLSDRALRNIVVGLGGTANGVPRQDGFDIIAASEIMAILCLSNSAADLKRRISNITVGYARSGKRISVSDLDVAGSMAVLLKDAIKPNLAQTLENNPAFIHGGPFANIAHGCNSVLATRCALKSSDIVVTEAGFGADLGAEKFMDIKCRKSGLRANAAVIVATVRALKYHGGTPRNSLNDENVETLSRGLANLEKHIYNVQNHYGVPCVVALNRFSNDTDAEIAAVKERVASLGSQAVLCEHWAKGGEGAVELAERVAEMVEVPEPAQSSFVYETEGPLRDKIDTVARKIYGLNGIIHGGKVGRSLDEIDETFPNLPVCIAKTQYSFTSNQENLGLPKDDESLEINELRIMSGAEFVTAICGSMMVMPGLPADPAACHIDISESGIVSGLF